MHEFSMMRQLVNAALRSAEENGVKAVHSLTIEYGEMTFLVEDQMLFAFEVLAKGTVLEGTKLKLERIPAAIECPSCGYTGPLPKDTLEGFDRYFPVLNCPECGGRPRFSRGKECVVREMSAEV